MRKVLFLTPPNVTLFQPKAYQELAWGASLVAGGVEAHGFNVTSFDLNAWLARNRSEDLLTSYEKSVLTSVQAFAAHWVRPQAMPLIDAWISRIMRKIGDPRRYDAVAFALDNKGYKAFISRGSLHFALLLNRELRKAKDFPVCFGGKALIKELGTSYIDDLYSHIEDLGVNCFFTGNGHESYPLALHQYFEGHGPIKESQRYVATNSSFKSGRVLPKYDIENREDIFFNCNEIIPDELIKRYPHLKDAAPICIVPFRHSTGCPYKCSFCQSGEDKFLRLHDVHDVVDILSRAKKAGFENFRWYNDNLNIGPKYPEKLADHLIEENLGIYFSDSANMIHTSEGLLRKLRQAGCVKLWYGSETLSPKLLKQNNKQATVEDFYRTVKTSHEVDIWVGLNIIISFPHETIDDFMLTYNFLKDRMDLYDCVEINIYRLLGGTAYAMYPEKFKLKILASSRSGKVSAFDEIGGMSWNERLVEASKRRNLLEAFYPVPKLYLFQNDYLLFFLLRNGFNRAQAYHFMSKMYDIYEREGRQYFFPERLDRGFEPRREIPLGSHIMGSYVDPKNMKGLDLSSHIPE